MTETPTTAADVPAPRPPGIFGTKVPSAVTFAVGIILFLLPFTEIKCGGSLMANKSGIDLALGKDWKAAGGGMFGNERQEKNDFANREQKGNTQAYAIAAIALAVIGLGLAFASTKSSGIAGLVCGVLTSGILIALMVELKRLFNNAMAEDALKKTKQGLDNVGFDRIGEEMSNVKITQDFTPWFYVAIVVFLAAGFFSFKRSQYLK